MSGGQARRRHVRLLGVRWASWACDEAIVHVGRLSINVIGTGYGGLSHMQHVTDL